MAAHAQTLLLVNDREADLLALDAALSELDVTILRARSADAGLEMVRQHAVDLAIVDLHMPEVDGLEMVRRLRRIHAKEQLPVLIVSAFDAPREMLARIYALGATDFVPLPLAPEALRGRVNLLLELRRQTRRAESRSREVKQNADAALAAQNERFRLLADSASDYALFFMDESGRITDWPTSAEHLFGFSAADAVGQNGALIFTPEDRAAGAPEAEMEKARRTGQAADDRVHVRKDGTHVPVTGRLVALRGPDARPRGFAKIVRDATTLHLLRENEQRFREIFENAHEGIWLLDANARVQLVNSRMAEMLGYTRDEIVGRSKFDFLFPEDMDYVRRLFDRRRLGESAIVEVRFRCKDGQPVWTLMSARPRLENNLFIGTLDMFSDITKRRAAEEQFRVFFELSAAGHVLIDPETRRFLNVNRRFCEITGRSPDELLTLTFTDITHPDDKPQDDVRFSALFQGRVREVIGQKRYIRPDGSVVWVHLTSTLVNHGSPKLQLTVVQDISALKATEEQLQQSQTRLRLAIDAADLGVFFYDSATGEHTWNDRMKELLGVGPEATTSAANFLARVHPEDRSLVAHEIERLRHAPAPQEFSFDYRVFADAGQQTVRQLAAHGTTHSPPGAAQRSVQIIGTLRDVTAAKLIEEELRRKVAERTRELEDKTHQLENFCYTVAHDLRAPLRSINGYADLLIDDFAANAPEPKQILERIKASTRRLDSLIRDLLAYSRVTQIEIAFEGVDLGAAVDVALNELRPEIERTAAGIRVPPTLPVVKGDKTIIEQIILNLISNAVKFGRPGQRPEVEISATERDGWIRLVVRDEGIGIPPAYHDRIFKVFERLQVSREYPGTGIGLAIVAKGMERLGGRYGVESQPDQGSAFWIEFKKENA